MFHRLFNDTKSKVVVPLLYTIGEEKKPRSVCYGVLSVEGTQIGQFGPREEEILKLLSTHAAIAIMGIRMIKETRQIYTDLMWEIRQTADSLLAANLLHDGKNSIRDAKGILEEISGILSEKRFVGKAADRVGAVIKRMSALHDIMGEMSKAMQDIAIILERLEIQIATLTRLDSDLIKMHHDPHSPFSTVEIKQRIPVIEEKQANTAKTLERIEAMLTKLAAGS